MRNLLIEMILVSGLLFGYYILFLRNKPFHFFNRVYLMSALLIAMAVPFLHIPVGMDLLSDLKTRDTIGKNSEQTVSGFPSTADHTLTDIPGIAQTEIAEPASAAFPWIWLLYGLGVLILLLRMVFVLIRIARLLRTHAIEQRDGILVVITHEKDAPFSFYKWLFWNNSIDLDSPLHQQIIRHETVHIRQKHSIDIIIVEIITAFTWINPFAHLIKRELRAVHEFLADGVVTRNTDKAAFAKLLLIRAMDTPTRMGHNFFGSITARRISMLAQTRSYSLFRRYLCMILAAFTIILFSFDTGIKSDRIAGFEKKELALLSLAINKLADAEINPAQQPVTDNKIKANLDSLVRLQAAKEDPIVKQVADTFQIPQKQDEISLLNYHDGALVYSMQMPDNNIVPAYILQRSPVTQAMLAPNKTETGNKLPVFYPAPQYSELVMIFNRSGRYRLDDAWRLEVKITDERGNAVKETAYHKEWISGYESARIPFNDLPKGTYHLYAKSKDHTYAVSCVVIKDYDG